MELRILTWADFQQFNPYFYPQERYGDFSGTILDIMKDERIRAKDRIWAATRRGMLDDKTLRLFACKCVRQMWHLLTDERSRKAVEVAERYAVGEATDEELAAAGAAAWLAAEATASSARWAVVRSASDVASRAAAWADEVDKVWDAAFDSAWASAIAETWEGGLEEARSAALHNKLIILIDLVENQSKQQPAPSHPPAPTPPAPGLSSVRNCIRQRR